MFSDQIQWADDATRDAAILACDGDVACLFDAASTNDVSLGTNSKDINVQLEKENEELGKLLPVWFCLELQTPRPSSHLKKRCFSFLSRQYPYGFVISTS